MYQTAQMATDAQNATTVHGVRYTYCTHSVVKVKISNSLSFSALLRNLSVAVQNLLVTDTVMMKTTMPAAIGTEETAVTMTTRVGMDIVMPASV